MRYIIAYDITNDRTRYRAANLLLGVGDRIQRSVYECDLNTEESRSIGRRLAALIDPGRDIVHVLAQCGSCVQRSEVRGAVAAGSRPLYWVV